MVNDDDDLSDVDNFDEAQHKRLAEASAVILEALTKHGRRSNLRGNEAGAAILIALGRFTGRHGYRSASVEEAWKAFTTTDALFRLGFESERKKES